MRKYNHAELEVLHLVERIGKYQSTIRKQYIALEEGKDQRMKNLKDKWTELDIKRSALIVKLNGKFKPRKRMIKMATKNLQCQKCALFAPDACLGISDRTTKCRNFRQRENHKL